MLFDDSPGCQAAIQHDVQYMYGAHGENPGQLDDSSGCDQQEINRQVHPVDFQFGRFHL